MADQLFPDEIIANSAERNFSKHSVKTKIIYSVTVLFLIAVLLVLPFIKTNISVRSRGVVQPIIDRNKLRSMVGGEIQELLVKEHTPVHQGQTVARIASPLIQEKIHYNIQRQKRIQKYLSDLAKLHQIDTSVVWTALDLKTSKYTRSFLEFKQQAQNIQQKIRNAKNKFKRDSQLYRREVLSKAKFDQTVYNLKTARNDFKLLFEQQLNTWQVDLNTYREELDQLKTKRKQLEKERQQYTIQAPISGTIQNMKGIYEGSYISPNQTLAEISPDTGLIAECYVPPKDIGLIREGMKARFQVSAFDYNQWGILTGKVIKITEDVTVINNQPVFIVRSSLDRTYLELTNGYKGKLRKGMTLQARFMVTHRTLFQLLYDNVEDWLNPNWDKSENSAPKVSMH